MKILFFETLDSTQTYLKELVKSENIQLPLCVVANMQTKGIGSRDNTWISQEGNLFVSFALKIEDLPEDLKIESASIYFSYLLLETLQEAGSNACLKWPNDLYIKDKKIAGMITTVIKNSFVCGVGLNMKKAPENFGVLDLEIDKKILLEKYFKKIEKKVKWKQVFRKYKLHFQVNQNFLTDIQGEKISLSKAVLEDDGSLNINGKRIYSLR